MDTLAWNNLYSVTTATPAHWPQPFAPVCGIILIIQKYLVIDGKEQTQGIYDYSLS